MLGQFSFLRYNKRMPTEIYKSGNVSTISGKSIYITPLKIRYMRQFMKEFTSIEKVSSDIESMEVLVKCCAVAMQQYAPELASIDGVEDNFDMDAIYDIIDLGAGITLNKPAEDTDEEQPKPAKKKDGATWDELDLAKLESEVFLLGIWKDYEELETSLCMQELSAILEAKRDADYQDKRFLAAIQGVDLDKESGQAEENKWEEMKARVAAKVSGVENKGGNDITSYVGVKAKQKGFGIGMGLAYEKMNS